MCAFNPLPFLNAYTASNAPIFLGRETEAARLANLLADHRHVVLYGPAGAGKTSLIQAGLTPYLAGQGIQVHTFWLHGDQACLVHTSAGPHQPTLLPLSDWLAEYAQTNQPVVWALDQLDSLMRQSSNDVIGHIARTLTDGLAQHPTLKLIWVIRDRNLYTLDRLIPPLTDILSARLALRRLSIDAARRAIVEPIQSAGLAWSPALLTTLLIDLGPDEIAPPALQVVCATLIERLPQHTAQIELEHYRQLGGARGILSSYLDDHLGELPDEEEQNLARALLKEMVVLADPGLAWERYVPSPADLDRLTGDNQTRLNRLTGFWQKHGIIHELPIGGHTLTHAFLVHRVSEWAQEDRWATKDVRDMLQRALLAYWRTGKLIDKQGLGRLRQSFARMRLSDEELSLILHSALAQNFQWSFWVDYSAGAGVSAWEIVRQTLQSPDPRSRSSAVQAISALRGPEVVSLLTQVLNDPYPNVRGLARSTLAALGGPKAIAALRQIPQPGMILIPAGPFIIGSDAGPDEQPVHQVYLDAFYLDRYPVTNAEYAKFIQDTGYPPPAHWASSDGIFPPGKGHHPVAYVCWFDARDYAAWAGKRLPTEAEWEKAARGPYGRQYPWGDQFNSLYCNTDESEFDDTTPVDAFSPEGDSFYGVADMSGNVWEWVADWYDRDYYRYAPDRNPPGPEKGATKVVRGGAWDFSAHESRCAMRNHEYPGPRHGLIGFRCAADPAPGELDP